MKKRLLSILLTIACISTLLPTTARAEYPVDTPTDTERASGLITGNDDLLIEKPDDLNTAAPMLSLNDCILSDGFYYLIHDEKLVIYGSVRTTGDLVIPETLDGYPVYGIAYCAFWGNGNRYHLTSVHIPASVEVIDAMAFADLAELERVTFAEGSKLREIYGKAFWNCHALQSITIPASVTDLMTLAFFNCYALTSVTFEEGSQLKNIGDSCFAGTPLSSIELPDSLETLGDNVFESTQFVEFELPSGLKHIGELLFARSTIERIILPEELPADTDFGSMVLECENFKGFDTSKNPNYKSTDEGFYTADGKTLLLWYGIGATEIIVPDGVETIGREALSLHRNTVKKVVLPETVTKLMPSAFQSLWQLTHINIPSGITEIPDYAFGTIYADIYGDGIITLPDGITRIGDFGLSGFSLRNSEIPTALEEIGTSAFTLSRDSNGLLDLSRLTNLKKLNDEAFWGSGYITTVILPDSLTYLGDSAFFGCTYLESVTLGTGLEYIGAYAFAKCYKLKSIELPEGIVTYGTHVIDDERWGPSDPDIYGRANGDIAIFSNCHSLESVTLPEDMTKIPLGMFGACIGLKTIHLPSALEEIDAAAFMNCTALTSVDIPDTVKLIGYQAFAFCTSLKDIKFPQSLEIIWRYAFSGCESLTDIDLPDSLEMIGRGAFSNCTALETIFIPQNVSEIEDGYLFFNCSALKEIRVARNNQNYCSVDGILFSKDQTALYICPEAKSIPEYRVPDTVTHLGEYAFMNNQSLVSIVLPEGLKEIGYAAFSDCLNLTNFRIPDSVTLIDGRAFSYCPKLTEVIFPQNVETFGGGVLAGCAGLTYVTIPNGVTLLPGDFFKECSNLWGVTLPKSVREIGLNVFMDCPSLEVVNYTGSQAEWRGTTFLNTWQIPDWVEKMVFNWTAPELPAPTLTVDDDLTLRWNAVSGARTYEIYRATGEDSAFEKIATTENTSLSSGEVQLSESDYYKVRAAYGDTKGEFSLAVRGDGTQQTALAAPVASVELDSDNKPVISWNAVDGALEYEVWCKVGEDGDYALLASTDQLSLTHTEAQSGEVCSYKVRAISAVVVGEYSNEVTVEVPLAAPVVSAQLNGDDIPVISWSAVENAQYYEVWCKKGENGSYAAFTSTGKLSLTHTEAKPGEVYFYKVRAVCGEIVSEYSNEVSVEVPENLVLAAPIVKATNVASSGKIKLTWNKIDGAEKYEVWRATSKNGKYTKLTTTSKTTITNTSTTAGKTYYYKVRAIAGGVQSEFSAIVSRTCDCARTVVKTTNIASTGKIKISWNKVDGAVKYEVYRATSKNGKYTKLTTTTKTSVTNSKTEPGVTYYYRVKAIASTSAANSAASTAVGRTCDLARPTVTVKLNSKGKPVISWNKVDGAVKYAVYRATSENGEYTLLGTTTKTSVTNSKAEAGVTYYYKVRAIAKTSAANSAYSVVKSVTAK